MSGNQEPTTGEKSLGRYNRIPLLPSAMRSQDPPAAAKQRLLLLQQVRTISNQGLRRTYLQKALRSKPLPPFPWTPRSAEGSEKGLQKGW
nr:hypothetical protein [uncultured bacterium]